MKRENSFYFVFIMFLFVTCYLTCYILSNRIVEFGGLIATASAIIYPFTYFIAILFYERYGKNRVFELINFSIISLIFMGLMIALASTFTVYGGADGLDKIFNIDFRVLFSSVVAFIVGQYVNIKIYDYLGTKKAHDFLVSGTIAITIDSFLFIGLAYLGAAAFGEVLSLATGQYVFSVVGIIIYALCYSSLIPSLLKAKAKEEKIIEEPKEEKKAPARKRSVTTKKETPKKTTTKKTTAKSETSKKTTAKKTNTKSEEPKKTTTRKTTVKKTETKKAS